MKADLHMHTTASDGKYTCLEVLAKAHDASLDIISITDHDCFDSALKAHEISDYPQVILGIELSTYLNDESIHILGYFNENNDIKMMNEILISQQKNRYQRALKMIEKLDELYQIKLDLSFFEGMKSITRGAIAREIINQGYPYTNQTIFTKLLGEDCPAYIPSSKMSTKDGIDLIHKAKGLAVIAHPMDIKKNNVEEIIKLGVDGIEAIYPHQQGLEEKYRHLATKYKLFITAGTDFHNGNETKHGNLGDVYLTGADLKNFLRVLYER